LKFIVGIGNPDKKYEKTRHNVGFRVVEELARQSSGSWAFNKELQAAVFKRDDVWFLKSALYVNNTGGTVSALPAGNDFLVVCDDVNLEFAKMRLRLSGSAGGHHGLEDIVRQRGLDFPRLRIGIAGSTMPKGDLSAYVLQNFDKEEESALAAVLGNAARICQAWIEQGYDAALNCLSRVQSIKE